MNNILTFLYGLGVVYIRSHIKLWLPKNTYRWQHEDIPPTIFKIFDGISIKDLIIDIYPSDNKVISIDFHDRKIYPKRHI